jgi:type IV fimbrial biogenesis protein FimT
LMVTLSLMAILTTIAAPGLSNLLKDARLSTQSELLINTLNSARLEAVKRRINVTVCPLAVPDTATACSTDAADWSNGFGVEAGGNIIQRVQAKGDVTLGEANNETEVVFNGTWGSSTATRTFTLCTSGRMQQQINVALSGRISKQTNALCP